MVGGWEAGGQSRGMRRRRVGQGHGRKEGGALGWEEGGRAGGWEEEKRYIKKSSANDEFKKLILYFENDDSGLAVKMLFR